jgi:hypothetical protein
MLRFVELKDTEHPYRKEMSDQDMASVLQGIMNDENWMSLEEIEAAADHLFDHVTATKQTVEGVLTVQ